LAFFIFIFFIFEGFLIISLFVLSKTEKKSDQSSLFAEQFAKFFMLLGDFSIDFLCFKTIIFHLMVFLENTNFSMLAGNYFPIDGVFGKFTFRLLFANKIEKSFRTIFCSCRTICQIFLPF